MRTTMDLRTLSASCVSGALCRHCSKWVISLLARAWGEDRARVGEERGGNRVTGGGGGGRGTWSGGGQLAQRPHGSKVPA